MKYDKALFQILLVEPANALNCYPFSLTHHISELRCGALRLLDKVKEIFPYANCILWGNSDIIHPLIQNEKWDNTITSGVPTLLLDATVLLDVDLAVQFVTSINEDSEDLNITFFDKDRQIIAVYNQEILLDEIVNLVNNKNHLLDYLTSSVSKHSEKRVTLQDVAQIHYIWETLDHQQIQIEKDSKLMLNIYPIDHFGDKYKKIHLIHSEKIKVATDVNIGEGVVLDATNGTILIDNAATIMHNAVIMGPCYIGKGTTIKIGAKIYGCCSFGDYCKIGGEVEHSTFHNYSNKQHDGFIGNSYIGEWVNLGAGTSNSDLKNNYGCITMELPHRKVITDKQFIGTMIGDHTKTAINTAFTTGSVIGVSAMLATNNFIPKSVESFTWHTSNKIQPYKLEKALETAAMMMKRRGKEMSNAEIHRLKFAYDKRKSKKS
ncbi:MAG: hypothetical protein LBO69_02720 [Ignavibacteria bacterium]|jgi:UDP-N-acetylglucosamine diphosphorylase/glucosamine-1-phosphate N-acetyltransferase|nr:hypothetical protein [Ignavibacteria bacterium]